MVIPWACSDLLLRPALSQHGFVPAGTTWDLPTVLCGWHFRALPWLTCPSTWLEALLVMPWLWCFAVLARNTFPELFLGADGSWWSM